MRYRYASLFVVLLSSALLAQWTPIRQDAKDISALWETALKQGKASSTSGTRGFTVAYSIEALVPADHQYGSWFGYRLGQNKERQTWRGLIKGNNPAGTIQHLRPFKTIGLGAETRELTLVFEFIPYREKALLIDASCQDMQSKVDLKQPLLWLGKQDSQSSLDHLGKLFGEYRPQNSARDLVKLISLHSQPGVFPFLKDILAKEGSSELREAAIKGLGYSTHPDALQLAIKSAKTDSSLDVREQAVQAIESIGTDAAMSALIELVEQNPNPRVRKQAVESLGAFHTDRARKTIYSVAERDKNADVQESALEEIADSFGDYQYIVDVVNGKHGDAIRRIGIEVLVDSFPAIAFPVLTNILRHRGPDSLKAEALEAMTDFPFDMAWPILAEFSKKGPIKVRKQAIESMGDFQNPIVITTLESLALQTRGDIAEEAIEALEDIGYEDAIKALLRIGEKHPDPELRESAMEIVADRLFEI